MKKNAAFAVVALVLLGWAAFATYKASVWHTAAITEVMELNREECTQYVPESKRPADCVHESAHDDGWYDSLKKESPKEIVLGAVRYRNAIVYNADCRSAYALGSPMPDGCISWLVEKKTFLDERKRAKHSKPQAVKPPYGDSITVGKNAASRHFADAYSAEDRLPISPRAN